MRAATFSQLYGYLLEKNDFFLTQQVDFFRLVEDFRHASPLYDRVNSRAELFSFDTFLKFAPVKNTEINFGFTQAPPIGYSRSTHDIWEQLAVVQNYKLDYLRNYILQMRLRQGSLEPYICALERRQKTKWNSTWYSDMPISFAYITTHYEDFRLGLRYLSEQDDQDSIKSNLSLLIRPLLKDAQLTFDVRFRYRKALLRRDVDTEVFLTFDNFYQRLEPQYTPGIDIGYGLAQNLEFASGLDFSFPYKYRYHFERISLNPPINLDGTYTSKNNFVVPLQLRYRPWQNTEFLFSSDIAYCRQKLDYRRRETGEPTVSQASKLEYFNTQPSLTVVYLYEDGKAVREDEFSRLTKELLSSGQFLLNFKYLRDITTLDKSAGNGAQNRIDPYNVFLYPLDLFVAGTEYAAAFTGNKSDTATNTAAQNYNLFQFAFTYGLSGRLNAGAGVGYRSSSRFHHFTLGSSSTFDLKSRYYVIKPYWFFSVPCDWRLSENSLLSFVWYYVPEYRTDIGIEGVAKKFRAKTEYYSISAAFKVLF